MGAIALGVVLIGPVCPGPEIEGRPCPAQPWAGVRVSVTPVGAPEGRKALELHTDAQGRVLVDPAAQPAAGRWRLEVLAGKPTRCPSLLIDLPAAPGAALPSLECDSGRR